MSFEEARSGRPTYPVPQSSIKQLAAHPAPQLARLLFELCEHGVRIWVVALFEREGEVGRLNTVFLQER